MTSEQNTQGKKKVLVVEDECTLPPFSRAHYRALQAAQELGQYDETVQEAYSKREEIEEKVQSNPLSEEAFSRDYVNQFLQDVPEDQKAFYESNPRDGPMKMAAKIMSKIKKDPENTSPYYKDLEAELSALANDSNKIQHEPLEQEKIENVYSNKLTEFYKKETGNDLEIEVANSASSALKKARENNYDLVISDLGMSPLDRIKTQEDREVEENQQKLYGSIEDKLEDEKYKFDGNLGISFMDKLKEESPETPYKIMTSGHGVNDGLRYASHAGVANEEDYRKLNEHRNEEGVELSRDYNGTFVNFGDVYYTPKEGDRKFEGIYNVIKDAVEQNLNEGERE